MTQKYTERLSQSAADHLAKLRKFYDETDTVPRSWSLGYRKLLAYYYRQMIPEDASILEVGCGDGALLEMLPGKEKAGIDVSSGQIERARHRLPGASFELISGEEFQPKRTYDVIILSDTLNQAADCQLLLHRLQQAAHPGTRLLINVYNALWSPLLRLSRQAKMTSQTLPLSWLSRNDVFNFLHLSEWEPIRHFSKILLPVADSALAAAVNRWLAPWCEWFSLVFFVVARPLRAASASCPSLSIVVPARNEAGNIAAAVRRVPAMSPNQEWIFVEGGSSDNTWSVIQSLPELFPHAKIKMLQQSGKGKANATWEGFAVAEGDVLVILDADLTMPPEELPKFYEALTTNKAEFANGVRLVYPMDDKAMPFLNLCVNKLFAVFFTWLIEQPVKDTLCGTKMLTRAHYDRIAAGRDYFGDFDPFGDFDLLFGAARLNLKIADIPIRYKERTYGQTNISRWKHGLILLRMVFVGARKLKFC